MGVCMCEYVCVCVIAHSDGRKDGWMLGDKPRYHLIKGLSEVWGERMCLH